MELYPVGFGKGSHSAKQQRALWPKYFFLYALKILSTGAQKAAANCG